MASNAMRAKATLPWLLLAAYRHNTRTLRIRDAGAWAPSSAGTAAGPRRAPSCACCARASSASRCVASGRPLEGRNVEGSRRKIRLSGTAVELTERVPSRVGRGRAVAGLSIQIGTTGGAEPLAVLTAQGKGRHREQPLLPNRRPQIERQ